VKRGKLHDRKHIGNKSVALEPAIALAERTSWTPSDEYLKFFGEKLVAGVQ